MNWKKFLKNLLHVLVGSASAAGAVYLDTPGVNPLIAAAVGSGLSSLISLNTEKPK